MYKKYPCIKNFKFLNLPRILIVTLKRFEFNKDLNKKLKINKYFEFPNILFLNSYANSKDAKDNNLIDNYKYILKGIIIHKGDTENGQYWSIIRDIKSNKWIKFDDTNVNEINFLDVKNNSYELKNDDFLLDENENNAYILFYSILNIMILIVKNTNI